ncbi:hypothetical protein SLS62_006528 [Diatrype stigma]|uniref:Uncharacterized protein n=1 Tax=Diatrype stigma TaxID=117547 RepID=A0AAN9YMP7_9PEZI
MAQAFTDLLALIDNGALLDLFDGELKGRIGITVFQSCLRTLLGQRENGSWNNSIEQTSYGVLILAEARRLSYFEDIQDQLECSIRSAVDFIVSFDEGPLDYLWIEKVTYRSSLLADAYILAALKASTFSRDSAVTNAVGYSVRDKVSSTKMAGYIKLVRSTPMFSKLPKWEIQASFLEASLFQPLLRARRLEIFPRKNMEEDKYFDMIPFIWTLCNNHTRAFASTTFLFDMMVISFLNFQADEFMEGTAGPAFVEDLPRLRHLVESAFTQQPHSNGLHNGNGCVQKSNGNGTANGEANGSASESNGSAEADEADVSVPLQRFVRHVLNRADVASASAWDRRRLERELRIYLLSHVAQVEDNARLARQEQQDTYHDATETFFDWVRTTSSDQTSGPYAFALVCCMMSSSPLCGGNRECFPTVSQKYFAQALCRHLSTMCRMYNDYGSAERDAAEGNLSSLNFPEFASGPGCSAVDQRKRELYKLAEYERGCMDEALARLGQEAAAAPSLAARRAEARKLAVWRVFVDVTDLHGQIYVVRDIASRIKAQQQQKQEKQEKKEMAPAPAAPHTNGNGAVAAAVAAHA